MVPNLFRIPVPGAVGTFIGYHGWSLSTFALKSDLRAAKPTRLETKRKAGLAPRREVAHLLDHGDERPADVLLPAWSDGRDICDVAVISPFARGVYNDNDRLESSEERATKAHETRKIQRYRHTCERMGLLFVPFVLDTLGTFGK